MMRALCLTAALLVAVPGDARAQRTNAATFRIDYVHEKLPNGLNVIYHVDRSAPIVAVNSWYNVGSKHEQIGRTGLAHLYEHIMLFKGSRNIRDQERFALLEQAGGHGNARVRWIPAGRKRVGRRVFNEMDARHGHVAGDCHLANDVHELRRGLLADLLGA